VYESAPCDLQRRRGTCAPTSFQWRCRSKTVTTTYGRTDAATMPGPVQPSAGPPSSSWSDTSAEASPRTEPEVGSLPPSATFTMLPPPLWSPPADALRARPKAKAGTTQVVVPGSFEPVQHYYPRVLNAQLHPLVAAFMQLGNDRIVARYTHVHPDVDASALRCVLRTHARHFRWAGNGHLFSLRRHGPLIYLHHHNVAWVWVRVRVLLGPWQGRTCLAW
jgi:hypothetical protein